MRRTLVLAAIAVGAIAAAVVLINVLTPDSEWPLAQTQPAKGTANESSAAAKSLTHPLDGFGLALLQRQAQASPEGNVVISPVSLHAVLSMVLNGAGGETATEMQRALGLESLTTAEVNQGWADLIWLAQSGEKQEIRIADSLWLRAGFRARQAFLDVNRDYFAAETRDLPVDSSEAAGAINEWVKSRTAGRITDIVTPDAFDEQTVLALFNTVHLDVRWKHFDEATTSPEPFTLDSGQKVDVSMMHAHELKALVAQSSHYDAVALATDGPVVVWIIVPKGKQTAETLLSELDAQHLEALYDTARSATGSLALPRFTSEYEAGHLESDLAAMGMPRAFSPAQAEFPGIADVGGERLYISKVVQKTFVDFNEQGVEAAAASGAIMRVTSVPTDAFDIRADRPFLFVLAEKATQAPLFLGLVRDPR